MVFPKPAGAVTTGTPISLMIENTDQRSRDYGDIKDKFRPGHADYTYQQKYGIRDYRGGGRSSARETAMRVAAGAIAKKYLKERAGIEIAGFLSQLGPIELEARDLSIVDDNPFFSADPDKLDELDAFMTALRQDGDSIGAKISVLARHMPVGLGEPVFDKLEADLAHGLMSINAVKGVEVGAGFAAVTQRGSQHRDEMTSSGFSKNDAGGTLGGLSSGQDLLTSIALKPTSSISKAGKTIEIEAVIAPSDAPVVDSMRTSPCRTGAAFAATASSPPARSPRRTSMSCCPLKTGSWDNPRPSGTVWPTGLKNLYTICS